MRDYGITGPRILILERNAGFGRLLRSQLVNLGLSRVRLATDTEEALTLLAGHPFDAILADAETGPLRAARFVRSARDDNICLDPFVPILASSFCATLPKVAACRDAGANGFLAKPASVLEISERLRVLLHEPRRFIRAKSYFGPDRRKGRRTPFYGPDRRVRGPNVQLSIPAARAAAACAKGDVDLEAGAFIVQEERALA